MSAADTSTEISSALAALWRKHRQTNLDRVTALEDAVTSLLHDELDDAAREAAERTTHKLAGSLGTFGFELAARRCLEAESLLRAPRPDARRLAELVVVLRRDLTPEVTSLRTQASPGERATSAKILLVTNAPELSSLVVADASAMGIAVETVASLTEAERRIGTDHYRAVLVDLEDPASTAATDILRVVAREAPTIMLSASDSQSDRLVALRAGAVGFVPRGQSVPQTLRFISQLVALREGSKATILVVSADPELLDAAEAMLSGPERRVVRTTDAHDFWTTLEEAIPSLLIVDLDLGDVGGLELCGLVRSDPHWQHLPVLVLSPGRDADVLRQLYQAGADDHVATPLTGSELRLRADALITRAHARRLLEIDAVTGTENRVAVERSLDRLVRLASRRREPLSLAIIEFDLEDLNERHGTTLGNTEVRRVGEVLRSSVRAEDIVGRLTEDRFVVGLYGMSAEDASDRVRKLIELIDSPTVLPTRGATESYGLRVGLSSFPRDGTTVATLAWSAENALDQARRFGTDLESAGALDRHSGISDYDVVVVDDDETIADVLVQTLESRAWRVLHFADGAEAVQALTDGRIRTRLMLLDLGLPGLDGFGVLLALAEAEVLEPIHTIVVSARCGEAETLRALSLGADEYVPKPFSLPVLLQRIETTLRGGIE